MGYYINRPISNIYGLIIDPNRTGTLHRPEKVSWFESTVQVWIFHAFLAGDQIVWQRTWFVRHPKKRMYRFGLPEFNRLTDSYSWTYATKRVRFLTSNINRKFKIRWQTPFRLFLLYWNILKDVSCDYENWIWNDCVHVNALNLLDLCLLFLGGEKR